MSMLQRMIAGLCISAITMSLPLTKGVWASPSLGKMTDSSRVVPPSPHGPSTEPVRFPGQRPDSSVSDPSTYPFIEKGQKIPAVTRRSHGVASLGPDLAYGRPYQIKADFPDEYWKSAETAYPDRGQLTDGRLGTLDFTDPAWVGRLYQYTHTVTIDLGQPQNVRGMAIDFLSNVGAGVVPPDAITYLVSLDGRRFIPVGTVNAKRRHRVYQPDSDAFLLTNKNVNARYVRAQFTNKLWAFIDEFAVFGTPLWNPYAPSAASLGSTVESRIDAGTRSASSIGFAREGRRKDAIHNLVLVYTHGHGDLGTWHERDFLPLVGGATGRTHRRPLFDTVLFTPYSLPSSQVAWKGWLDNLFQPGIQLHALDDSIAHRPRKWWAFLTPFRETEGVVITIPSLAVGQGSDFARKFPSAFARNTPSQDARFSTQSRSPTSEEAVYRWYVHEVIHRFRSQHFGHLRLIGLYWEPESLRITDPDDGLVVKRVAKMVHQNHLRFVWIPFYGAVGVSDWRALGFDLVMLQPNVSFQWGLDANRRLRGVGRFAATYGTGVELEAHWDVLSAYPKLAVAAQERYFAYFRIGREIGFAGKDVPKGWYLNSKTLIAAFHSANPLYRRVYDETVRFIEGEPSSLR